MEDISVQELNERMKAGTVPAMIDVREEWEYENAHIEGTEHHPLGMINEWVNDIQALKDTELVMICRSGGRSGRAADFLRASGFTKVRNMTGGMLAWKQNIDPTVVVE